MSEAPKRIWVASDGWPQTWKFGHWDLVDDGDENVEYVRADEIERLRAELRAARELLDYYRDQFCEGFCKDLQTGDFYSPEMDLDCAGCRARAFLAKVQP